MLRALLFTPDALAGRLPATRAEVRALFEHAFRGARREGVNLALIALQLDDFERVAEERGVPYGAALLCRTVADVAPQLGEGVVCGWRERERVYLVVQRLEPAQLVERTHALVSTARRSRYSSVGGPSEVSVSVGTAHVALPRRGEGEPEPDELVAAAGRCLRLALLAGGGQVVHAERLAARRTAAPAPPAAPELGEVLIPARPPEQRPPAIARLQPVPGPPPAAPAPAVPHPVQESQPAPAPQDELLGTRVSRLERRLSKLSDLLEKAIEGGVSVPKEVERGVASTYREVQGLSSDDESYEAKSALMSTIFEANLALHERHRERAS